MRTVSGVDASRSGGQSVKLADAGHLQCPFCGCYDVDRMYVGGVHLDACQCLDCGQHWDEEAGSGRYQGRSASGSFFLPRS